MIQPSEKLKKLAIFRGSKFWQLEGTITNATRSGAYCEWAVSLRNQKVTLICTICEAVNSSHHTKVMLSEVHWLLSIYLTVPMTSATAERIFSTLRHLKNFLCSTITQKRLNNLIILHTNKNCTDNLDLCALLCHFASANDHHRWFLGLSWSSDMHTLVSWYFL